MRNITIATVATALLATAATAHAGSLGRPCTAAPQSQWLSIDNLRAKIEAQGYTVRKAALKKACGEFYTLDRNGQQVELFVDPTDGRIVGQL